MAKRQPACESHGNRMAIPEQHRDGARSVGEQPSIGGPGAPNFVRTSVTALCIAVVALFSGMADLRAQPEEHVPAGARVALELDRAEYFIGENVLAHMSWRMLGASRSPSRGAAIIVDRIGTGG